MFYRKFAFAAFIATLPVVAEATTTITFDTFDTSGPYSGNGKPFTTYTESGFTVSAPVGQYQQSANGNLPDNGLLTGFYNTTLAATLTITGPGLFTFDSFQGYSEQNNSTYTLSGYLGGVLVYSTNGLIVIPPPGSGLTTYGNQYYGTAVDQVTFETNAPFRATLDNFTLSAAPAAVPEPATWAMMVGGFGLVGGAMRRRKQQVSFS